MQGHVFAAGILENFYSTAEICVFEKIAIDFSLENFVASETNFSKTNQNFSKSGADVL